MATAIAYQDINGKRLVEIRKGKKAVYRIGFKEDNGLLIGGTNYLVYPASISDEDLERCCLAVYRKQREDDQQELLTVSDIARLTGFHEQRINMLIQINGAPARRIGMEWFIPQDDFFDWLEGCEV